MESKKIIDEVVKEVLKSVESKTAKANLEEEVFTWTCPLCLVQIKQSRNIGRHKNMNCTAVKVKNVQSKQHQVPAVIKCKYCPSKFSSKGAVNAHIRTFHLEKFCHENKEMLLTCEKCDFQTISLAQLRKHDSRLHALKGPIVCEYCDKNYSNKDSLRVHMKKAHVVVTCECEVCGSIVLPGNPCNECDLNENLVRTDPVSQLSEAKHVLNNNLVIEQVESVVTAAASSENLENGQVLDLPQHLKGQVNFSCKLLSNAGGSSSLYRASAQHAGLGEGGWLQLRKYCHSKVHEWWLWYEPYFFFPLVVKVQMFFNTYLKRISNSEEFLEFLKTDESLVTFPVSKCELYCLANVLGVNIYQLSYNLEVNDNGSKSQGPDLLSGQQEFAGRLEQVSQLEQLGQLKQVGKLEQVGQLDQDGHLERVGQPQRGSNFKLWGMLEDDNKSPETCRWDTFFFHKALIHKNQFNSNKGPLHLLCVGQYFTKIIQDL